MAVLSNALLQLLHAGLMRYWSDLREGTGTLTKADLRAAIDAVDSWVDSNAASLNTAIPQPARNQLSTGQKALILACVALLRFDQALVRRILQVD